MRNRSLLLGILFLVPGCVHYEEAAENLGFSFEDPPALGNMTAFLAPGYTHVYPCQGSLLPLLQPSRYCGERLIVVRGDAQLPYFPINLTNFAGPIHLRPLQEGWNLSLRINAAEGTRADVERDLASVSFEWQYRQGAGYALSAAASAQSGALVELDLGVDFRLNLTGIADARGGPLSADVDGCRHLELRAQRDLTFEGSERACQWLRVQTPNQVDVSGLVGDLEAHGSSIRAWLTPVRHSAWSFTGTAIDLAVPERPLFGYDLSATATKGDVKVNLKDGNTTTTPNGKRFVTADFEARDARVLAELRASPGNIHVAPT